MTVPIPDRGETSDIQGLPSGQVLNFLKSGFTFRNSEYKDLSSKYFFLTAGKSAHYQGTFECDSNITCYTNRRLFSFQKKGVSEKGMTNM